MDTKELRAIIASETNTALSDFALRHSVGLGLYSGEDYPEVASGTLLRIGSRYFVATAAHCLRRPDLEDIRIAYREKDFSTRFTLVRKGILGGTESDSIDVGYLEIDKSVLEYVPAAFLTLDHIAVEYDSTESIAFLFGFPAEFVPKDEALKRRFRFRSLGFITLEATADTTPDFVDKDINVVLEYPDEGELGAPAQLHPLPHPGGASGGSIWIYNPNLANPVVGVHNARLVGIQKSWLPPSRIVIGNKIENLLRLIARDYPDLSDLLYQRFGAV